MNVSDRMLCIHMAWVSDVPERRKPRHGVAWSVALVLCAVVALVVGL